MGYECPSPTMIQAYRTWFWVLGEGYDQYDRHFYAIYDHRVGMHDLVFDEDVQDMDCYAPFNEPFFVGLDRIDAILEETGG